MENALFFTIALMASFLLSVIASRLLIPVLRSRKMGQKILDIGPRWHKSKEGTPTMGGVAFILAMLLIFAAGCVYLVVRGDTGRLLVAGITFGYAILNALIGLIDDMAKFRHQQNEGLTAPQKYLLQLIVSALYLIAMSFYGGMTTVLYIPFIGVTIELGFFYYIFALILLTGVVNSVNLTDGIDGLAATETLILGIFYAMVAFFAPDAPDMAMALLSSVIIGGMFGFLMYNFHPARVFMGDTGSLFLGGLVVGCAFMLNNPLIVIVAGIMYIFETLSVMLQVLYFKLTHGKRLFKMSPIHHHFEQCGWSEIKIVSVFSLITALACGLAFLDYLP